MTIWCSSMAEPEKNCVAVSQYLLEMLSNIPTILVNEIEMNFWAWSSQTLHDTGRFINILYPYHSG